MINVSTNTNYTMDWNEEIKNLYNMMSNCNLWMIRETCDEQVVNAIGETTIKYNKERHFCNLDGKELSIRIELYDDCLAEGNANMEIDRECDIHTFVNIYLPILKPNAAKAVKCKYDGREFYLERYCDEGLFTSLHTEIDYCSNAYILHQFM